MPNASQRRGVLFVVSAASGTGKTTLVNELIARDPQTRVSVSHTTRPPRPGEQDGVAYHFTDERTFMRMIGEGAFMEHARVFDRLYGTSRQWVEARLDEGLDVILEIDWQGARQVRAAAPAAVTIFILPPSLEVLEQRLRGRGDDGRTVQRRMRDARAEIAHFGEYDYLVVNDDRERALADLHAIVTASRRGYRLNRGYFEAWVEALLRGPEPMQ